MTARSTAVFVSWVALGAVAGLLLALAGPRLVGMPVLVVLTGSMEPEVGTGDVVVESKISPLDAKVGDVVTFRDPDQPQRLITHRVRRLTPKSDEVAFTTKGDANNAPETWNIAREGSIGRVEYRVPKVGYAIAWIGDPFVRLLLIVIPAVLLGLVELKRIWFPKPAGGQHAEA